MLSFEKFSQEILSTGDIDPDYLFYQRAKEIISEDEVFDLIHLKLCVYKTESELLIKYNGAKFENVMYGAERNKAKRSAATTYRNIKRFHAGHTAQSFKKLTAGKTYTAFNRFVTQIGGIGAWASWKYADILNKTLDFQINFRPEDFIRGYEYPLKGLCLVSNRPEITSIYSDKKVFEADVEQLQKRLETIEGKYAGIFNPVNVAEYETLLCKYHSYRHGRYKPQEDLHKLRKIKENVKLKRFHEFIP
jgi:hypothetical protein